MTTEENVPIDQIEKELRAMTAKTPCPNPIKACLFNLFIYTTNATQIEYFTQITNSIIERFPCRVIFIIADPTSKKNELKVTLSNDMIGQVKTKIASDQIILHASGEDIKKISFIVTPLIIPDIPIYLLWGDTPTTKSPLMRFFLEISNKVIFDLRYTDNIQQYSQKILNLLEEHLTDVIDLTWAYMSRWKNIIARLFDTEEKIKNLESLSEVHISYIFEPEHTKIHQEAQAMMLQAWLASRLKWEFQSISSKDNQITIHYKHQIVTINPLKPVLHHPGAITDIILKTSDHRSYKISRLKKYRKVVIYVTLEDVCELPFTMPLPSMLKGLTFLKELFYSQESPHYSETLKYLSSIDWSKQS